MTIAGEPRRIVYTWQGETHWKRKDGSVNWRAFALMRSRSLPVSAYLASVREKGERRAERNRVMREERNVQSGD